mmetsp:Transcript_18950/g.60871  ORF Transcript_18950/g.60871 Transcript_18950/m.60871 type:complete len:417 (-) Transcript_18950:669-1919(-)
MRRYPGIHGGDAGWLPGQAREHRLGDQVSSGAVPGHEREAQEPAASRGAAGDFHRRRGRLAPVDRCHHGGRGERVLPPAPQGPPREAGLPQHRPLRPRGHGGAGRGAGAREAPHHGRQQGAHVPDDKVRGDEEAQDEHPVPAAAAAGHEVPHGVSAPAREGGHGGGPQQVRGRPRQGAGQPHGHHLRQLPAPVPGGRGPRGPHRCGRGGRGRGRPLRPGDVAEGQAGGLLHRGAGGRAAAAGGARDRLQRTAPPRGRGDADQVPLRGPLPAPQPPPHGHRLGGVPVLLRLLRGREALQGAVRGGHQGGGGGPGGVPPRLLRRHRPPPHDPDQLPAPGHHVPPPHPLSGRVLGQGEPGAMAALQGSVRCAPQQRHERQREDVVRGRHQGALCGAAVRGLCRCNDGAQRGVPGPAAGS